eukprot:scaffold1659_cov255-Pinguiococcus_pyrenoidosus.AAC.33
MLQRLYCRRRGGERAATHLGTSERPPIRLRVVIVVRVHKHVQEIEVVLLVKHRAVEHQPRGQRDGIPLHKRIDIHEVFFAVLVVERKGSALLVVVKVVREQPLAQEAAEEVDRIAVRQRPEQFQLVHVNGDLGLVLAQPLRIRVRAARAALRAQSRPSRRLQRSEGVLLEGLQLSILGRHQHLMVQQER